ncbi:unnamed protein product [Heligmosomoides polygyrus]|uniref:Uncharacterized protein n=1 Tax=Heligmosomoides polygyrus TaxID=6339 RepID=A0A183G4Q8_HELPZ|nr:unnamed protein product [Heligmosomoides polygyrus]
MSRILLLTVCYGGGLNPWLVTAFVLWHHFTNPGEVEDVVYLSGKTELRAWYRVHTSAGASSDCATRAHTVSAPMLEEALGELSRASKKTKNVRLCAYLFDWTALLAVAYASETSAQRE